MNHLSAIWRRNEPPSVVWALLGVAAAAVGVAGYLHGHLFHEGYSHIGVVGVLFLLNAIGSGAVIAQLLFGRAFAFALGGLGISVGSLVSILFPLDELLRLRRAPLSDCSAERADWRPGR